METSATDYIHPPTTRGDCPRCRATGTVGDAPVRNHGPVVLDAACMSGHSSRRRRCIKIQLGLIARWAITGRPATRSSLDNRAPTRRSGVDPTRSTSTASPAQNMPIGVLRAPAHAS